MGEPAMSPADRTSRGVLDAVVAITGDLDLESVLRRIVTTAMELTGARYGALGVIEGTGLGRFLPLGLDDAAIAAIDHWPRGEGLLGLLVREPHPRRVADIGTDPSAVGFPPGHPPMRTFLGVPIQVRDVVYGNLYLTDKADGAEFTADDETAVVALAAAAGAAIDNARLYATAREVAVYQDRDRIARDLHDVVIQRLFASAMTLMSTVGQISDPGARARIEATVTDLDDTIKDIRATIYSLQTQNLGGTLAERMATTADHAVPALGFRPAVQVDAADHDAVSAEVADQLVVVLREALANVARHAKATEAAVTVTVDAGWVELRVVDDGIGISDTVRRSGLRNLSDRAVARGGSFEVGRRRAGPGTELCWRVPTG